MIPHFRRDARAGVSGEDDVGGLVGKVAVDAFPHQSATAAGEEATALRFMTGEAAL